MATPRTQAFASIGFRLARLPHRVTVQTHSYFTCVVRRGQATRPLHTGNGATQPVIRPHTQRWLDRLSRSSAFASDQDAPHSTPDACCMLLHTQPLGRWRAVTPPMTCITLYSQATVRESKVLYRSHPCPTYIYPRTPLPARVYVPWDVLTSKTSKNRVSLCRGGVNEDDETTTARPRRRTSTPPPPLPAVLYVVYVGAHDARVGRQQQRRRRPAADPKVRPDR